METFCNENECNEFMLEQVKTILKSIMDTERIVNGIIRSGKIDMSLDVGKSISEFNWCTWKTHQCVEKIYDALRKFKYQNESNDELITKRSLCYYLEEASKQFK